VLDGRTLPKPVNYALVRIVPPADVTVDPKLRPYVIIDPRAGHGPGIGGFKDDSQVGVALRAGHPVYFVIFYRDPEPGQTLLDVCEAEKRFVREVRARHPHSEKPAIVGNCQGGWAAMMLAAADPDDTGPIVINGAPMSYWGGAWDKGAGDNPMRYAGGMLGGTWLSSYAADIGDGVFDGAYLVENFESLNPANTFWDKYYHLYANVDTEPPRFLDFERWWGGFYLMNREEIEWITRNLFVGNKLWTGGAAGPGGKSFDLKAIRAPIVLFASMGDNITPPQQAFNWVADVYGSTDEIKARGQVIVGLVHQDVGHLGIFVSGKVAKKEHAQIVEVLKSIESLPAGLYAMSIDERKGRDGKVAYEVSFEERRLEDIVAKLNRFGRNDEKPFEAVNAVSEFNQHAYELFAQPLVQATSNEATAKLRRQLHPLRAQRWMFSDLNPWLAWLGPAAEAVKAKRQPVDKENAVLKVEKAASTALSASLEYYRALRDASSEAAFFQIYGNVFSLYLADKRAVNGGATAVVDSRELPFVQEALASIEEGGFPEALARVACLLARKGEPLLLSKLQTKREILGRLQEPAAGHAARPVAPRARRAGDHRALRARSRARHAAQAAREAGRPREARHARAEAARRRAHAPRDADRRAGRHGRGSPRDARDPGAGKIGAQARRAQAGRRMTIQARSDVLKGAKALVVGIANDQSIAYGCAKAFRELGADLALTYLNEKAKRFVEPLARELDAAMFLPLDVAVPGQLEAVFDEVGRGFGELDILVHSIAFAPKDDLQGGLIDCSAEASRRRWTSRATRSSGWRSSPRR
jgi:pimeloyl-ACP methyl ester carboxylesterase